MPVIPEVRRRLVWHGLLLFLFGLLIGVVTKQVANPRMALSAHVGALLTGVFLIGLGAVWDAIRLSARTERLGFWALVLGAYGTVLGLVLAAALGTRDSTLIHGAAESAAAWKETLVFLTLAVSAVTILAGSAVALLGFGARRAGGR